MGEKIKVMIARLQTFSWEKVSRRRCDGCGFLHYHVLISGKEMTHIRLFDIFAGAKIPKIHLLPGEGFQLRTIILVFSPWILQHILKF